MSEKAAERLGGIEEQKAMLTRGGSPGKPWEYAREGTIVTLMSSYSLRSIKKVPFCLLFVDS